MQIGKDCSKSLGIKTILKLPTLFQIDLHSLCTRGIVQVGIRTSRSKNPTKRTLARVKKKMDEPRMAESARAEDVNQTTQPELKKLP